MCTNFKMKKATDGTAVVGRSMEFPFGVPTSLGVLPEDYVGRAAAPKGASAARQWTARYGVVGMAAFGSAQTLTDGMNTAGVSVHALYMPHGCCVYADYKGDGSDVSELDVIAYLLGTCGSVAEVKVQAAAMNVWGKDPGMGFAPPLHFLVHDAEASIAIEFHKDGMRVLDNPSGVGTNAPYLEWHLTNLNNFVGMAPTVPAQADVLGMELASFGQGQGTMGLPGDYTAPSRFVRAAAMVAMSEVPADAAEAEMQTWHILNAFDIPIGLIREEFDGKLEDEVTVWITISNLTGKRYAYRTNGDPSVYVVDLADVDFSEPARTVPMSWDAPFTAVKV